MYFNYKDINLYYEKYGNKDKSIIILPGWGNTRNTFSYMIGFLKDYFTVYIIDYPGFGNTAFPTHDLTIYDYSIMIYEWIKYLELDNPILIGHSFGGRIITTLLGYYKYKFNNVIYLNSAGIRRKSLRSIMYKILKKISYIMPKKLKKKYLNYLFNKFASNDYKDLNKSMQKTFKNIVNLDLSPYLKEINSKVLLIWGNNDTSTPLKDGILMNKRIKDSELIILKGNHFIYLDYPYLINKILFEQLKDEII